MKYAEMLLPVRFFGPSGANGRKHVRNSTDHFGQHVRLDFSGAGHNTRSRRLSNAPGNEIEQVLDAGHLAPIRLAFGDLPDDHCFLYQELGRILTTLAWAWPYLTPAQQARALTYAEAELEHPAFAPWAPNFTMPRNVGARREWYKSADLWGLDATFGDFRPRLHTLYGFWLFCYRSGRTEWMQKCYA